MNIGAKLISPYEYPTALRMDSANSNRVDFGNGRFTNLTETNFLVTGLAVVRMRATAAQGVVLSKNGVDGAGGPVFTVNTGAPRAQFNRSSVNAEATSNSSIALMEWYCLMWIVDVSDTQPRVYYAPYERALTLAEVSYTGTQTQGSGTSNSTATVVAGNTGNAAPSSGFQGDIHRVAWYNARLTPKQGAEWMLSGHVAGVQPQLNCVLGFNGLSMQIDESGLQNHGVPIGASPQSISLVDGPAPIFEMEDEVFAVGRYGGIYGASSHIAGAL